MDTLCWISSLSNNTKMSFSQPLCVFASYILSEEVNLKWHFFIFRASVWDNYVKNKSALTSVADIASICIQESIFFNSITDTTLYIILMHFTDDPFVLDFLLKKLVRYLCRMIMWLYMTVVVRFRCLIVSRALGFVSLYRISLCKFTLEV